eukprot:m.371526 g.371526  ORF g.371526 m.371526 type:complete len:77 (-) comp20867_c0_seq4:698-928(-)
MTVVHPRDDLLEKFPCILLFELSTNTQANQSDGASASTQYKTFHDFTQQCDTFMPEIGVSCTQSTVDLRNLNRSNS